MEFDKSGVLSDYGVFDTIGVSGLALPEDVRTPDTGSAGLSKTLDVGFINGSMEDLAGISIEAGATIPTPLGVSVGGSYTETDGGVSGGEIRIGTGAAVGGKINSTIVYSSNKGLLTPRDMGALSHVGVVSVSGRIESQKLKEMDEKD